jgi:hypothetical protein
MGKFAAKKSSESKYYFHFEEDEDGLWSATIVSAVHGPLIKAAKKPSAQGFAQKSAIIQGFSAIIAHNPG